jgi:hypothetical protein
MLNRITARRRLAGVLVALFLLTSTGCVAFEKQTIVVAFPKGGKELRALLVYERVCVQGKTPEDMEVARKELTALAANDHLFYGGHPLLRFELEKIDPKDNESDQKKELRLFLKQYVRTRGEAFYVGKEGRLCFVQSLTIADAPKMLTELNERLSSHINTATAQMLSDAEKRPEWMDLETANLLHKASSEKSYAWLKLEPGRLSLTLPVSPEGATRVKRELFLLRDIEGLRKQLQGQAPKGAPHYGVNESVQFLELVATFFSDVPFSVDHRHDRVTFSVGVGDGRPIRIPVPADPRVVENGGQDEELTKFARKLTVPFREGVTAEDVIAEFLRSAEK